MHVKKSLGTFIIIVLLFSANSSIAQVANVVTEQDVKNIIPMRQRVQIMQKFWEWKKEHVLPMVMEEQGIELWIIRNNEADLYYNNEGPVFTSLIPANHEGMTLPSVFTPRSQFPPKFILFHNHGKEEGVEYFEARDYEHISEIVRERDPKTIAIGQHNNEQMKPKGWWNEGVIATKGQHNNEQMLEALGSKYASRTVDSWTLGVRWLETMSPEMISIYRYVQGIANDIIAEAFSNKVVIPGITTTDDINWWVIHRYIELGLKMENHPSIIVKRRPSKIAEYDDPPECFERGETDNSINVVIRRGDILSCDTDLCMLGLETDTHNHAYVLLEGETDVPEELKEALRIVNDILDEYQKCFVVGRTGKEIVEASNKIPLDPRIIHSSLAFHPPPMFIRRFLPGGYMFDHKAYVAGMTAWPGYYPTSIVTNDHKLYYNTLYAFGQHTTVRIPGWGEDGVRLGIEQIAAFTENGLNYLERSQETEWHVIR